MNCSAACYMQLWRRSSNMANFILDAQRRRRRFDCQDLMKSIHSNNFLTKIYLLRTNQYKRARLGQSEGRSDFPCLESLSDHRKTKHLSKFHATNNPTDDDFFLHHRTTHSNRKRYESRKKKVHPSKTSKSFWHNEKVLA